MILDTIVNMNIQLIDCHTYSRAFTNAKTVYQIGFVDTGNKTVTFIQYFLELIWLQEGIFVV